MRQSSTFPIAVLGAAALLGAALGYVAEAGARDRDGAGSSVSGGRSDRGEGRFERRSGPGSGGSVERRGGSAGVSGRTMRERDRWDDRRAARRDAVRRSASFGADRRRDRKWRDIGRIDNRYALHGSFVRSLGAPDGDVIVDDAFYGGSRFVAVDPYAFDGYGAAYGGVASFPSEPKFIDVETERLDQRPVAPGRIEITYTGGAKIIRIAPDYERGGDMARKAGVASVGLVDDPLQPWSAGWMKYCMEAYHSFDPELGTYIARDGKVRFCEGR